MTKLRKLSPQQIKARSPAGCLHRKRKAHYSTLKSRVGADYQKEILTFEEFDEWYEQQDGLCYYCQREMLPRSKSTLQDETIDRKDPTRSYSLDNMVLCCRRCNLIKGNWFTEQEMIEIANEYLVDRE